VGRISADIGCGKNYENEGKKRKTLMKKNRDDKEGAKSQKERLRSKFWLIAERGKYHFREGGGGMVSGLIYRPLLNNKAKRR
jgi:hypothetical protein